jgi:hypothetical protein
MKPPPSRLHPSQALLPALACVAIALVVFWPVLPVFQAQFAPDSMPYFGPHHGLRQIEDVLFRGDSIPPSILYWLALPPLVAHELTYLVDTLLMVAAGALYLLGRRVRPAVAWLGGAALGFSGYSFTLVSAGHRGYFHMMACTLFAFPLLERIFRKEGRRWPRFALLGFALGWGILTQPDVFTLVAALAVFYLLWLTFRRSAVEGCETEPVFHRIRRVWPGFAIALAAFLLAGGGIFHALATRFIPDRLAQMRGGTPAHAVEQAPAVSSGEAAERKREDWIFATNWSLPPEDMLEFVAPCVRGIETSSEVCPYWGRLGRSDGWETSRQGFRNFRQHTLYLGAIQVLFALLAVGAWFRHRKDEPLPPWLRDVPFWAVSGLVALLLSFGRYAPFYRVFYAIPGMSLLRAPVKLLHLTEICVAMLFACGLAEVLQRKAEKPLPLTAPVLLALPGIALVAASALVRGGPATLLESWKALGYPPDYARVFLPQMAGALLHGGLLWLAGVAIWLVGRKGGKSATIALLLAWLCVGGDLIAVSRLYIRPFDVSRLYRDHPLFDTILEDDSIPCPFVANLVSNHPLDGHDPLGNALSFHGIQTAGRSDHARDAVLRFRADPVRFWDVSCADYLLAPESLLKQLPLSTFRPLSRIDVGRWKGSGPDARAVLLRRKDPVPFAAWHASWRNVPGDEQLDALARSTRNPHAEPLVDAPGPEPATGAVPDATVDVLSVRMGRKAALDNVVRTKSSAPGLVAIRHYYNIPSEALLDGAPAPLRRCNALWCAVEVPAGDHEVVVRRKRSGKLALFLSLAAFPAFLVSLAFCKRARTPSDSRPA